MSDDEIDYLQEVQPLLVAGDSAGALAMAEKAIDADPCDHQAWRAKGLILQLLGRLDESQEALARAAAFDENGIDTRIAAASERVLEGDLQGALVIYQELLAEDDSLAEVWSALALLLMEAGQREQAVEAAQRSVALEPEEPQMQFALGHCLRLSGRTAEGLAALEKALDHDPTHGLAWYEKGMILELQEDLEGALSCFDQLLAMNPGDANAARARSIIEERMKE